MTRPTYQVTELLGDGICAELSRAIHRLATGVTAKNRQVFHLPLTTA